MNCKTIARTAAALLVLLAGACSRGPKPDSTDLAILTTKAERTDLTITVSASGEIHSTGTRKIKPEIKRSMTIEFLVPEGSSVTNGQLVAKLNTDDLDNSLRGLNSQLLDAQSRLKTAETQLEIQLMDNTKSLKQGKQQLLASKLEQEKLVKGDAPQERRKAELMVMTTERELGIKRRRIKEIEELQKEGFVTEDQVEEERIALEKAEVAFENAQVDLKLLNTYTLPLRLTKAENAVDSAETDLEKIRKNGESNRQQKEQAVSTAKLSVEQAQLEIDETIADIASCTVTSDVPGVVNYSEPGRSRHRAEIYVGGRISPGQTLVTIPDMSKMKAIVNVVEANIHKVAVGQSAVLTVEAADADSAMGTVSRIARVANSGRWWSSDVKTFEVEIDLDENADLSPGFSCHAEIHSATHTNALAVPLQAVFRDEDGFFVYNVEGQRTEVTTGDASDTHIAILDGLADGETVLLSEPRNDRRAD